MRRTGGGLQERSPSFHQQMVYAVSMKTISHFEQAMGRPVLWRHVKQPDPLDDHEFRRQLKIEPHALRQANAFYSPDTIGLRFGNGVPDDALSVRFICCCIRGPHIGNWSL